MEAGPEEPPYVLSIWQYEPDAENEMRRLEEEWTLGEGCQYFIEPVELNQSSNLQVILSSRLK
jgi:hypothetical protein